MTVTGNPSAFPLSADFTAWQARMNAGVKAMYDDEAFRRAIEARIS